MNIHLPDSIRDGEHLYAVRVYYEDTDAGGVVYHANYLRFAERARTEALRDLGVAHAEMAVQHGLMFMVRRIKVDYLGPARLDESLVVATRVAAIRGAVVELRQDVRNETRLLVGLDIQLACVRVTDQRPARVPVRWTEALMALSCREMAPSGAQ
jgi:acyl-CoA thioester hydrolase